MMEALPRARKKPHDWRSCWKKTICSTPFLARPSPGVPPTSCAFGSPGPARTASRPLRSVVYLVALISTNRFGNHTPKPRPEYTLRLVLRRRRSFFDKTPLTCVVLVPRCLGVWFAPCRGMRTTRSRIFAVWVQSDRASKCEMLWWA